MFLSFFFFFAFSFGGDQIRGCEMDGIALGVMVSNCLVWT